MNPLIILFNLGFAFLAAYAAIMASEEAYHSFQHGNYVDGLVVLPAIAVASFLCLVGLAATKANLDGEDF